MNAAFDVGADDGFHGILFAFFNKKTKTYYKLLLLILPLWFSEDFVEP